MDEYIDREAAIKAIEFNKGVGCSDRCVQGIKYIPAADVVEVVRCKDCQECMEFTPEYKEKSGYYGTCRRLLIPMLDDNDARIKADDYCSYGERKEDKS